MSNLLARYAECVFWMARQVERADSLARILDVHATFSMDSRGDQNWHSVLQLYAHEKEFQIRFKETDADSVIFFYILDRKNPYSVLNTLYLARENARTIRPLISTEMWRNLNTFYGEIAGWKRRDITEEKLNQICSVIKESCQAQMGIAAETFYRDEGWYFFQLGMNLERADQTTRLLDVKYHLLLPSPQDVGSPLDLSQWRALLRSAAGFHAYRRIHPSGVNPERVAAFLLLNRRFPRSVASSVGEAAETLTKLRRTFGLRRGAESELHLLHLRDQIVSDTIEATIGRGLHEHLDWVQRELARATDQLGWDFFGHDVEAA